MNQNSQKRTRRERERERHRQEILEAALRVFARAGYHRATMQAIAKEAEFAVGTIYRFFPSKKALYEALVMEEARKFHQEVMEAFKDLPDDPIKALEKIIEAKLEAVQNHLTFVRVYLQELWEARFRGGLTADLRTLYEEYLEALAKVLERLGPREISAKQRASLVDGLLSTLIVEAVESGSELPHPQKVLFLFLSPLVSPGGDHVSKS